MNQVYQRQAALHLKAKLEWFSQQKRDRIKDHSFRADHSIGDVPDNLKNLLFTNKNMPFSLGDHSQ